MANSESTRKEVHGGVLWRAREFEEERGFGRNGKPGGCATKGGIKDEG